MSKIYAEDKAKIASNNATAGERAAHNRSVDAMKESKMWANRRTFIPRKASHKQGH